MALFLVESCGQFYADKKNVKNGGHLYIYPNTSYATVLDSLSGKLINVEEFDSYAQSEGYDRKVKPGKYKVSEDDTNKSLVERLMSGKQEQVKVRIKNSPTLFHMARDASRGINTDSAAIIAAIKANPRIRKETNGDIEKAKIYFLPNTYYFEWLTSGEKFVDRMLSEHDKFWNADRKNQLQKTGMTELQVYTLASIVQMEAPKADEQKKVAQAYLNRLKMGKKLEADPTSVYAYKLQNGFDETIKRVLNKHISTPSDYNTYLVTGLPPGPITLPNSTAIDAVLQPEPHEFIYFCADPDRPGYHSFTSSYAEHEKNAAKYRKWLRENNIK